MKLTRTPEDLEHALLVIIPIIICGIMLFICWSCDEVFADKIPEDLAVRCIIGEAANQGDHGMLVLAEALRNRGTTKGVYGCSASHVVRQPEWVFKKALKAWRESAYSNHTNGATNWENINAFGTPYWAKSMIKTYEYKDHVFYRSVK